MRTKRFYKILSRNVSVFSHPLSMPWHYTPCKIAWTHSEFWRKILRGSLTAELQNTILWLLGVIYSFPEFPIVDLYSSTRGTHGAFVLFNHMQFVLFHDTQKLTKTRNEDRNELQLIFLETVMCFHSKQNLSPHPRCLNHSPGPCSKHSRIKSVRCQEAFPDCARKMLESYSLDCQKVAT